MSDMNDYFNRNQGFYTALGNMAAISQRSRLLAAQREQIAAIESQNAGIQSLQRTAAEQLELERRRVHLEELRANAEAEERALRQEQLDKLREIRNVMADTAIAFEQLKKQYT
jgi:hypothetical protein